MRDSKLINIIEQSFKRAVLDFAGLNVLLPESPVEPALAALLAGRAGAAKVFMVTKDIETINKILRISEELKFPTKYLFMEKETPEALATADVVIKGKGMSFITPDLASKLKNTSIISLMPEDFDFTEVKEVDLEGCFNRRLPVLMFNPWDKDIELYKYFAHYILKKCYEMGLDVFRSKILLVSHGDFLENIMSVLKNVGAQVYAVHTDAEPNKNYIMKHLPDLDALIVADYPVMLDNIIGNNTDSLVEIEDIKSINPDLKLIQISGKVDIKTVNFNNIEYNLSAKRDGSLSLLASDFGVMAASDMVMGVLGSVYSFMHSNNLISLNKGTRVAYRVMNSKKCDPKDKLFL